MNQTQAMNIGRAEGFGAAIHCEVGDSDRKQADCECVPPAICCDCLAEAAYESEQNARQFTPWEFIAKAINECGRRAQGLWDAYERGVGKGIWQGVKARLGKEDK